MKKLLLFCGIWILTLPMSEGNIAYNKKGKIDRIIHTLCILAGCNSLFIALDAFCNYIDHMNIFLIALYIMLILLSVAFSYKKMQSEKEIMTKGIIIISGILLLVSMMVIFWDFNGISFSCLIMTADLIILSASEDEISFIINGD